MKILVTGITGFIGRHLCELWKTDPDIQLYGTGRWQERGEDLPLAVQYFPLDIIDANAVQNLVSGIEPDCVIHSAAMSKPNDCETDKEACYAINVTAVQHVVDACRRINCRLIFMSSDMVFGDDGPYTEADEPCPVNFYGESKAMAEKIVAASGLNYAIVRTVLVYGKKLPGLQNTFLHWVYDNISQQKTIRVFTDQFRTATYVNDLCKGIAALTQTKAEGIFHICGGAVYTPFEIARAVANYHGMDELLVQPVTNAELQETARRPQNCTLKIDKAKSELNYKTTSLSKALEEIFG